MSKVVLDDSSCFDIDKVSKQLDNVMVKIFGDKPTLTEEIYFHRDKDDNGKLVEKAFDVGIKDTGNVEYLGYEVSMKVQITNGINKVLEIQGIDVSDKDIFI